MGKQQSPPEKIPANAGKGKVTPVQIAFIVDRYLADSGYTATLASFRSEAAGRFSKTRNREPPKGLLSLAEILDEYVKLKEQRIVVDQEKHRVEALLRGINDAVQAYHSAGIDGGRSTVSPLPHNYLPSPSTPHPPPPSEVSVRPAVSSFPHYSSSISPLVRKISPDKIETRPICSDLVRNVLVLKSPSPVVPGNMVYGSAVSTPIAQTASTTQRKNPKPILRAPAAPRKYRGRPQAEVPRPHLKILPLFLSLLGVLPTPTRDVASGAGETAERLPLAGTTSAGCQPGDQSIQGSSVAKSLFMPTPGSGAESTSPETPKAFDLQMEQADSTVESMSIRSQRANVSACRESAPSTCSVISSKTLVVSPLKSKGYYVEKSVCISSSPMKSSPKRLGKRINVKGRLDFDGSDRPIPSEEPAAADGRTGDIFDLDLPDLDVDFSFSDLLVNIDLDCEDLTMSCQVSPKPSADLISGSEGESARECLEVAQEVSDPGSSAASWIASEKTVNTLEEGAGDGPVTFINGITKRIKLSGPGELTVPT
ncbi:unnamed protein product [Spirodela intermedia]|uniref:Uncharacterized protein n=1 Tax=Spirodela intermedia TaxID=51605 RepID=A0A7I8JH13_SPIIN|nr:unnamed protein product [Spirodela intermedia]CAA6669437.1 unnamed protein product [Spirodela intermedia]